jgi:nitroreductase
MDFKEVFSKERATRKFTAKKVNEKTLAKIIEQSQQSPSLLNSQPWRAYAVTGQALADLRAAYHQLQAEGKDPEEDFASMLSLNWDTFPSQNMANMGASQTYFFSNKVKLFDDANNALFDAPVIVFLTIPKQSPAWSVFDLGIFAQSIMLHAIDAGLATMPAHSLVSYPNTVRKIVGIPENESVGMAIGLGYPDRGAAVNDKKFIPDRLPLAKIYKLKK